MSVVVEASAVELAEGAEVVVGFDYDQLDPHDAWSARQAAAEIRKLGKRSIECLIGIGCELARVKARLGHGRYLAWLKAEFGWTDRTALNWVRLYETFKSETVSDLEPIDLTALYRLAAPSTSPEVRRAALDQAKAGERVTAAAVAALAAREDEDRPREVHHDDHHRPEDACTIDDLRKAAALGLKFGTIYADPPWRHENEGMSVEELCALPVRQLAADDAHLHLWTTDAFLFECPRIFDAWGFTFKSSFVWVKTTLGIGDHWRNSHEILLTAVRGKAKRFRDHSLMSWMECDRGEHSGKPERVRGFLERASPGPRLELFGRQEVAEWAVWGDQVPAGALGPGFRRVPA